MLSRDQYHLANINLQSPLKKKKSTTEAEDEQLTSLLTVEDNESGLVLSPQNK